MNASLNKAAKEIYFIVALPLLHICRETNASFTFLEFCVILSIKIGVVNADKINRMLYRHNSGGFFI